MACFSFAKLLIGLDCSSTNSRRMFFIVISLISMLIYSSTAAELNIHHSLTGDYYVQWKEYGACPLENRGTNEIFPDVHLTKKRQGVTELVGKTIFLVPFDDNITVNLNFNILGSNSRWLPNAYHLQLPKACTSLMNLLRDGWREYLKNMGIIPKCPIPEGAYELKGFDMNHMIRDSVFPKEFIYGQYKVISEYSRFGKLVGCAYVVIQVAPIWQKKTKKNDH